MIKLFGEDNNLIGIMEKQFALGKPVLFQKEQANVAPYIIRECIKRNYENPVHPLKSVLVYTDDYTEEATREREAWRTFLGDLICRIDYAKHSELQTLPDYDKEQDYEMLIIPDISKYKLEAVEEIVEDVRHNSKCSNMKVVLIDTGRYSNK